MAWSAVQIAECPRTERALADAVLVGATTIRLDNPILLVRFPARRSARQDAVCLSVLDTEEVSHRMSFRWKMSAGRRLG